MVEQPEHILKKPLVIVDVTAILFRMYFGGMSLFTRERVQIGGVWGICTTLRKIIAQMKPKYFVAVFDAGIKTFRNDIHPNYKANRGHPPDDLIPQFELAYQLCESLGIHCFRKKGVEADDLMASLALLSWEQEHPVHMVTVDKDLNQMVRDDPVYIHRINIHKKQLFNTETVINSMGVRPEYCTDFMALVGDPVDSVPGVKGIGPKKAAHLIQKYGSIESIYEKIDIIMLEKGWKSASEKLLQNKENAFLSKQLVTLRTNIDVSSQVTMVQQDLLWTAGDSLPFLSKLGLERYHSYLQPI